MKTGVDYYPEHWDKSLWEQDADLMKKAVSVWCVWRSLPGVKWNRRKASMILPGWMRR